MSCYFYDNFTNETNKMDDCLNNDLVAIELMKSGYKYFMDGVLSHVPRIRFFLYLVSPWEGGRLNATQVPDYFLESFIMGVIILHGEELLKMILNYKKRREKQMQHAISATGDSFHETYASFIIMALVMLAKCDAMLIL